MDIKSEPKVDDEEVRIDDNVDQLFEEKMKKLREIGLYDDRMINKLNLIKEMDSNPSQSVPRSHLKRGYQVLGRPEWREDTLVQFKGQDDDKALEMGGAQGFKPIEGGLKWSLPIRSKAPRDRRDSPPPRTSSDNRYDDIDSNRDSNRDRRDRNGDRDRRDRGDDRYRQRNVKTETEVSGDALKPEPNNDSNSHSNEAFVRKTHNDFDVYQPSTSETADTSVKEEPKRVRFNSVNEKPNNFNKFFDNRRSKPEEKTDTIVDIEAFIRDCNKKAEKPKPLILDDIDDFIAKADQRFKQISANLEKTYSS